MEKDIAWHWTENQQNSFDTLKRLITQAPILRYFDRCFNVRKAVKISVDASSQGLDVVLLQDEQPVAYASRTLTCSQVNYAQIEKEMLAIVLGCTCFHDYVYGLREVQVKPDHKFIHSKQFFKKPQYQAPVGL